MPATEVTPEVSGHAADGDVTAGCPVCPHPLAFHDRIAARYGGRDHRRGPRPAVRL